MYLEFPIESTAYQDLKTLHDAVAAGKRTLPRQFRDRVQRIVEKVERTRRTDPSDEYGIESVMACIEHFDQAVARIPKPDGFKDVAEAAKKRKHLPNIYLSTWTMGAENGHHIDLRRAGGVLELHDPVRLGKELKRAKGTPFALEPHFGSISAGGALTKGKGWEDAIAVGLVHVLISRDENGSLT
ncbi:MAG: hypothetical protein ACE37J_11860 [Pikeienuella sp.]|uniref:hypothetical protein n=1 Tax=Pikeienuella sp. TaxID=2831957 RepID=UPI00391B34DF